MPTDNPRSSVSLPIPDSISVYHVYTVHPSQCCSAVVQHIDALLPVVWSFVQRFDDPLVYMHFVRSCHVISFPASGRNSVGSLRRIEVVSGLSAADSTERLEILNDRSHVISFSIVGRDHRLANYHSVTTLHEPGDGTGTVVSGVLTTKTLETLSDSFSINILICMNTPWSGPLFVRWQLGRGIGPSDG